MNFLLNPYILMGGGGGPPSNLIGPAATGDEIEARGWRVTVWQSNAPADNVSYQEVNWRHTAAGADVSDTVGATVFAQNEFSASFIADYFNDGDIGTRWAALGFKTHFGFLLADGDTTVLREIFLDAADSFPTQVATVGVVEFSLDGISWAFYGLLGVSDWPALHAGEMVATGDQTLTITPFAEMQSIVAPGTPRRYAQVIVGRWNTSSGTLAVIGELELLDNLGADLLDSVGFSISATSQQGSYPVTNLTDNDTATSWAPSNGTGLSAVTVDFGLGTEQAVYGAALTSSSSSGFIDNMPKGAIVRVSDSLSGPWEYIVRDQDTAWTAISERKVLVDSWA